ncbi:hypothetical protein B4109_0043 [Geobacillus stearothermophilus]|uniref:Uncharacterized protein n=1 Tax=Geobacillus stearothermophilus TaxID=1422 RepID=A0A150M9I8_GEOSE|nr:hypothetical protein B4109_0043 [Geobacillus stearothermophilus]
MSADSLYNKDNDERRKGVGCDETKTKAAEADHSLQRAGLVLSV